MQRAKAFYCFRSFVVRRTTRGGWLMLLLGIPQEVAKKGTKGTPLGTPLPDGFLRAVGAFYPGKLPSSWAYERTPKMGSLWQKSLLSPPAARVG